MGYLNLLDKLEPHRVVANRRFSASRTVLAVPDVSANRSQSIDQVVPDVSIDGSGRIEARSWSVE
jgi:hypothetical protein